VCLLGGFRVVVGDTPIPAAAWQRRPAAIFKLLALDPAHRLHREQVMETLWPDLDLDAQANNLSVALHAARKALASAGAPSATFLTRDRDALVLGPPEAVAVDVDAFEQAVAQAWRSSEPAALRAALDRYAGDLLPDDPYDAWLEGRRAALRTSFLALLTRLGQLLAEHGDLAGAIAVFQRLIAAEPTQEEAHVALMRLYALAGQRTQALAQYDQLVATLERDLDGEPEDATHVLAEAIRAGRFPDAARPLVPDEPPPPPSRTLVTYLPAFVSDLVGREREVAEVRQLLSTARLVTLTGPGGIGKTRLGVAVAGAVADAFADGVVFVDLAPLPDASLVPTAIAMALNVRESRDQPLLARLTAYLRDTHLLLVLDNFEHVADAAPVVAALLEGAPRLRIIVTSRTRLRLRGEREYAVPALGVPDTRQPALDAAALQYPAVALFAHRVQEVRPAFRLTHENAPDVAAICTRLDGLPLAIELAAARSKVLTTRDILTRLDRPLALLTGGPRDLPSRQQTMRATIQWSYDLLAPADQRLLRRLAVFVGGWSLEAAEDVANADRHFAGDVLDRLLALVDMSLVTRREAATGAARFTMLETIRAFAREQLAQSGEAAAAHEQHARVFVGLAERAIPDLYGEQGLTRFGELLAELDNLRAALTWMLDHDPERALHVIVGLERFWYIREQRAEWRFWLDQALNRNPDPTSADQAMGHCLLAFAAAVERDLDTATVHAETGLALFELLEDQRGIARAINMLGIIAYYRHDPERAVGNFEESLTRYREIGDQRGIATQLNSLGTLFAWSGDYGRGLPLLRESLALYRTMGDSLFVCRMLNTLGTNTCYRGNYEDAIPDLEECLVLARDLGVSVLAGEAAVFLGRAMFFQGDIARAISLLRESLVIARDLKADRLVMLGLEGIAFIASVECAPHTAGRLFGAGHARRESLGERFNPEKGAPYHRYLGLSRSALGEAEWSAAWNDGCAMTFDGAIAYALEVTTTLQSEPEREQ
jgi:predicted ATPase/DNA-binding SARP family transcriptional activator